MAKAIKKSEYSTDNAVEALSYEFKQLIKRNKGVLIGENIEFTEGKVGRRVFLDEDTCTYNIKFQDGETVKVSFERV